MNDNLLATLATPLLSPLSTSDGCKNMEGHHLLVEGIEDPVHHLKELVLLTSVERRTKRAEQRLGIIVEPTGKDKIGQD